MMTAMIKPPDPHSDSEDSDSRPPPLSTSHTKSLSSKSKSFIYQPNIKSKPTKPLSTPNISPSYPIINTTPVIENSSSPPPNYNLHINPQVNLSSRHSQLPPLSSPPYFHISPLPVDTDFNNSSNDSLIHNEWQSTKLHPPTPLPIKTNDIPLTSVNSMFDQPESPVKTCNFDNTIDSTDSDFETLPNPIYSNSSENSFPTIYPRIADSPNTSLTLTNDSQFVYTYTRAPHSPYTLRSPPLRTYNFSCGFPHD